MKKRRFRIEGGKYGGELTIGKISPEFFDYWKEKDEGDLIDFIVNQEDYPESPQLDGEWYEVDDIEHVYGCYADAIFHVTEVPIDGSDDDRFDSDCLNIEPDWLYGREAYHDNDLTEQNDENNFSAILIVHTGEKGDLGSWFVETDENGFNPKKLLVSVLETNFGEIIEDVWYGKEKLENDGMHGTDGKSTRAEVGWIDLKRGHDNKNVYTDKYLEEEGYWADWEEEWKQ